MKVSHRSALSAAGLAAALAVSATPSVARCTDAAAGAGAGHEESRRHDVPWRPRRRRQARGRDPQPVSRRTSTSGSSCRCRRRTSTTRWSRRATGPDSALSPNDIKELAKLVRGDEVIDGDGPTHGRRLPRQRAPLPAARRRAVAAPHQRREQPTSATSRSRSSASTSRRASRSRAYQECEHALRGQKVDVAVAAARKGTGPTRVRPSRGSASPTPIRPGRTVRIQPPSLGEDSVLAVTNGVLTIDRLEPDGAHASVRRVQVEGRPGEGARDTARVMEASPNDAALRERVIAELVQTGQADKAIPIIEQMVKDNPGDPQYLRTKLARAPRGEAVEECDRGRPGLCRRRPDRRRLVVLSAPRRRLRVGQRLRQGRGVRRTGDREVSAQRPALPAQGAERA